MNLLNVTDDPSGRYDSLTGLLNRRGFVERAPDFLIHAYGNANRPCLLLIDFNTVPRVAQFYGGYANDYLESLGRAINVIALAVLSCRLGSDEFLILCDDKDQARAIAEELPKAHKKVLEQLLTQITPVVKTLRACRLAIGIAQAAPDISIEQLIRNADKALYKGEKSRAICIGWFEKH